MKFEFDDVVVDAGSRQVLRAGAPVHVSPKAFDFLVALIRERPRVLSKEDLHVRLWPNTFVSDTSLAMLVAEVRAALGESAREPRAVRTVHRHGYAFQADAREVRQTPGGAAAGRREMGFWLDAGPRQKSRSFQARTSSAAIRPRVSGWIRQACRGAMPASWSMAVAPCSRISAARTARAWAMPASPRHRPSPTETH